MGCRFSRVQQAESAADLEPAVPLLGEGSTRPSSAVAAWRRIVRSFLRLRSLQRYWAHLGQYLQLFPSGLRDRLRQIYPATYP